LENLEQRSRHNFFNKDPSVRPIKKKLTNIVKHNFQTLYRTWSYLIHLTDSEKTSESGGHVGTHKETHPAREVNKYENKYTLVVVVLIKRLLVDYRRKTMKKNNGGMTHPAIQVRVQLIIAVSDPDPVWPGRIGF
jgi:hypothetical protein